MSAFLSTLNQMLYLFLCIMIGFALNRFKILGKDADVVISRLENYVFVPALVINTFYQYCTVKNLTANASLLLYNTVVVLIGILCGFLFAHNFTKDPEETGVFKYALTVVNFGFMGNALLQGLLGDEMLFKYLIFCIPANVFAYSLGIIWLTAGKKKFSFRMLVNPMFITMIIGIILGFTQPVLPAFLTKTISSCAGCYSALAMILTGFVIGKFDIKKLILDKRIYVLTLIRIVLVPLFTLALCRILSLPGDTVIFIMFFVSMPLGLNTIVFPAAYGGNEKPGASMAVISNVLGLITVPLILSLVL